MAARASARPPLAHALESGVLEAGVDEAGRGCLAGPVVAAAVVFPPERREYPTGICDSKLLSAEERQEARQWVQQEALAWGLGVASVDQIGRENILQACFTAMHEALDQLCAVATPAKLLVDGNRFRPYGALPHSCQVKGDQRFVAIAAASILAKTYRDELMAELHQRAPQYGWRQNKGYPTPAHRHAIALWGPSPWHRPGFKLLKSSD